MDEIVLPCNGTKCQHVITLTLAGIAPRLINDITYYVYEDTGEETTERERACSLQTPETDVLLSLRKHRQVLWRETVGIGCAPIATVHAYHHEKVRPQG